MSLHSMNMQRPNTSIRDIIPATTIAPPDPIFILLTKDIQPIEHQVIKTALNLIANNEDLHETGPSQADIDLDIKTAQLVAELELDGYYRATALLISFALAFPDFAQSPYSTNFHPRVRRLLTRLAEIHAYTHSQSHQTYFNLKSEAGYEAIRNNLLKIVCQEEQAILLEIASQTTRLQDIEKMPLEQQQASALACMNIYAPLADKLGVWRLKSELEDFSFRHLQPQIYEQLRQQLDATDNQRSQRIQQAI